MDGGEIWALYAPFWDETRAQGTGFAQMILYDSWSPSKSYVSVFFKQPFPVPTEIFKKLCFLKESAGGTKWVAQKYSFYVKIHDNANLWGKNGAKFVPLML